MHLRLTGLQGESCEEAAASLLTGLVRKLDVGSGKAMAHAMVQAVQTHFESRFPGSKHWSPDKVHEGSSSGNAGEAVVDVPGVSRAYHDVTIKPIRAKALAIPVHQAAYGKKPAEISGLFIAKAKSGKAFLAKAMSGGIAFMYVLKDQVRQKQDQTIMPSDGTLANAALQAASELIENLE